MTREKLIAALAKRHLSVFRDAGVFWFDEIDSTNREAARLVASGFAGNAILAAGAQSAGRGRLGRSFYSPAGTGIYFSLLYRPETPISDAVRVTSASAVAVSRAIRAVTGRETSVKWVNDLFYNGKKVCGILAESVTSPADGQPRVILGIGVNLFTEVFPAELTGVAGGLGAVGADAAELIAGTVSALEPWTSDPTDASWLPEYRALSAVTGKRVAWKRGEETGEGIAQEIRDDGALPILGDDGVVTLLSSGEISLSFPS